MPRFLRIAVLLYLLATGLGLFLRYAVASPVMGLDFQNALHAHSHTLYFGWAALALFTLFFRALGADDAAVRRLLGALVGLSLATFAAFLHSGYHLPGIIVSACALPILGWAVVLVWRRARSHRSVEATFLRIAAAYVVLAGVSASARVVVQVVKPADPFWGELAVFGFLHAFGAFFAFGLMGLLARWLREHGAPLEHRALRWQLGLQTPLSALTFPLGVAGGSESFLGPTARLAAVVLVVPGLLWAWNLGKASGALPPGPRAVLRTLVVAWLAKTAMEAAGAFGLAELATAARHPAILYLHVELLGVVTAGLLFLLLDALGKPAVGSVLLHQAGVAVMAAGLGVASLGPVLGWSVPAGPGLWAAVAGGAVVVTAGLSVAARLFRGG